MHGSHDYLRRTLRLVVVASVFMELGSPIYTADTIARAASTEDPLPLSNVTQVIAGEIHTCAVLTSGTVQCWGSNGFAQLGHNNKISRSTPANALGLAGPASMLAAGKGHTCALLVSGDVQCWGLNESGQLGTNNDLSSGVPVKVMQLGSGITAIASAFNHVCALFIGGAVKCWGHNTNGQLGNNAMIDSGLPVSVVGLDSNVSTVTTGWAFSCAVLIDGTAKCWGGNYWGQLGNGATADSSVPVSIVGLKDKVKALAAGVAHACALLVSGAVQCWGVGSLLGGDNSTFSMVPVDISSLGSGVQAISSEASRMCALLTDGTVKCWGMGVQVPTAISGLSEKPTAIVGGALHTCALLPSTKVQCWGENFYGQLGNNSNIATGTAVTVVLPSQAPLAVSVFMPFADTNIPPPPPWQ